MSDDGELPPQMVCGREGRVGGCNRTDANRMLGGAGPFATLALSVHASWDGMLTMPSIKIGAVIRDSHRGVGIVCSEEPTPTRSYINKLVKSEEVQRLGPTKWWGVAPLSGGYVL